MIKGELVRIYRDYIACLNRRDFAALDRFVHANVSHNGRPLGVSGYREMHVRSIPDEEAIRREFTTHSPTPIAGGKSTQPSGPGSAA